MLDFPLIDTHFHIWDLGRLRYPWLDKFPTINRNYLFPDFDTARGGYTVEKLVFIQCECLPEQYLDELNWVRSVAETEPRLQGIVPWAPVELGDACEADFASFAADKRIKGVRRIIQFERDDFCLQPGFITGVRHLGKYGLHFEITTSTRQLENVEKLVRLCPETRFVLDHVGNPDLVNGNVDSWERGIRRLAEIGDVWCKVSGLATNADNKTWRKEQFTRYFDYVVSAFGTERIMYAGDWPHSLRAISYTRWLEVLEWTTKAFGASDRRAFFRENAVQFYRL